MISKDEAYWLNSISNIVCIVMTDDTKKPFACTIEGCEMTFTNEDHLNWHQKKHDMVLNLGLANKNIDVSDQTPTPTRFMRNCEEVGLFQDLQHVNPFDETFKKAVEAKSVHGPLNTLHIPETSDDTLHTPHIFPPLDNSKYSSTNNEMIKKDVEDEIIECLYLNDGGETERPTETNTECKCGTTKIYDSKEVKLKNTIHSNEHLQKFLPTMKLQHLDDYAIESGCNCEENSSKTNALGKENDVLFLTDITHATVKESDEKTTHKLEKFKIKESTKTEIRKRVLPKIIPALKIVNMEDEMEKKSSETNCKRKIVHKSSISMKTAKRNISGNVPTLNVDTEIHEEEATNGTREIENNFVDDFSVSSNDNDIHKKTYITERERQRIRESNRAAQKRCRQKKEHEQKMLRHEIRSLRIENVRLKMENAYLQEELAKVKQLLIDQNKTNDMPEPPNTHTRNEDCGNLIQKTSPEDLEKLITKTRTTIPVLERQTGAQNKELLTKCLPCPSIPNILSKGIILQVPSTTAVPTTKYIINSPDQIIQPVPLVTAITIPVPAQSIIHVSSNDLGIGHSRISSKKEKTGLTKLAAVLDKKHEKRKKFHCIEKKRHMY